MRACRRNKYIRSVPVQVVPKAISSPTGATASQRAARLASSVGNRNSTGSKKQNAESREHESRRGDRPVARFVRASPVLAPGGLGSWTEESASSPDRGQERNRNT